MVSRPESQRASSSSPTSEDALVGKTINKYEIVRLIGRGGMGTVYEAINTSIGKRVAMKFVDAESAHNKDAVARFQREAQAASAVESAHIVEIFDSGTSDEGLPFIVMELLRGEDLGHRIKRCGRLELSEALHITAQILRGLHRAHEAGIIHRDLKPDNIFLVDRDDDADFAKVLDFGISKMQRFGEVPAKTLTREGTVLGTPFYMAPEQAQALNDIDGRADLWSVGAILYECLSGRPPHSGTTYEQVIINICMKDPEDIRAHNPAVPEALAKTLAKALCRDKEGRFSSARELLDALVTSSGGLLPARLSRWSGDEAQGSDRTSGPNAATPIISGKTPMKLSPDPQAIGLDPTLEVQSGGPSKVGWSTQRRNETARRNLKLYVALAAGAVAIGAGALFFQKDVPSETKVVSPQPAALAPAPPAEVAMRLRSNVTGARFSIDGVDVPDSTLRGRKGETKKVRVEADGYAAVVADVTLDPAMESMEIPLGTRAPEVAPAPEGSASSGAAAASPTPTATAKAGAGSKKPPATAKTAQAAATAAPTAAPATTKQGGVAGGLTIRPE
jgi:serine/threonine protein kinase